MNLGVLRSNGRDGNGREGAFQHVPRGAFQHVAVVYVRICVIERRRERRM
jgi:hypothetical protein